MPTRLYKDLVQSSSHHTTKPHHTIATCFYIFCKYILGSNVIRVYKEATYCWWRCMDKEATYCWWRCMDNAVWFMLRCGRSVKDNNVTRQMLRAGIIATPPIYMSGHGRTRQQQGYRIKSTLFVLGSAWEQVLRGVLIKTWEHV